MIETISIQQPFISAMFILLDTIVDKKIIKSDTPKEQSQGEIKQPVV